MKRAENSRRGNRDRISSLPDCLIHLIMSFLTTQQAVQTCILSKRWKNLWTTLPFLHFDLFNFKHHGDPRRNKLEKFRDFVSMTLLRCEASDLHKFNLSWHYCHGISGPMYDMFIGSWILYALRHNPRVLVLGDGFCLKGSLPFGVFTCASLVDVSLHSVESVHNIEVINLPCLRRLHLARVNLNQDFVDKLFCGCPVLQFLHLKDCFRGYSVINSQRLKYLKLEDCDDLGPEDDDGFENKLELINTPNLLKFCYANSEFYGHEILLTMPSLTSANIILSNSSDPFPFSGKSNILTGLSDVKNLQLSGNRLKALLKNELPNCPEFLNLKDLSVGYLCLSCHFKLLASFLNHCPNLEKLSLQHDCCNCWEKVNAKKASLKIAPFKGKRLGTVKVEFDRYDENFPRVMKYLQDITKKSSVRINMTCLY